MMQEGLPSKFLLQVHFTFSVTSIGLPERKTQKNQIIDLSIGTFSKSGISHIATMLYSTRS